MEQEASSSVMKEADAIPALQGPTVSRELLAPNLEWPRYGPCPKNIHWLLAYT